MDSGLEYNNDHLFINQSLRQFIISMTQQFEVLELCHCI